jgi:hypothetical protein
MLLWAIVKIEVGGCINVVPVGVEGGENVNQEPNVSFKSTEPPYTTFDTLPVLLGVPIAILQ